ncbi:ribosome biogenesis protein SLX9-domain-containing protein [Butyriboletus roseoflavus]|nr:ribosome biogenesis protein SLX9-domain-containing protein [Butyriboletus roseoflavus]
MPASSTASKPPSLPSLSSSNIAHSYSVRTHGFIAPSNTRAVVTAPPWAQDEPPSPTDQPDEIDRIGRRSTINTRPSCLASSSRSSFEGLPRKSDNRSRWWTFVRPHERSGKHDWRGTDTTDHNRPLVDDRQSQHLANSRERQSDESPAPRSTVPSPALAGPPRSKPLGRGSPQRGRNESQDENRGHYAHMGEKQDAESGEKSTLGRSRKNRFRTFILSNIYVPLLFRFTNITFTTSALAVAIRIRLWEADYDVMGAVGSSPTLVIIFAPLTLVHVMVAIYVEYFSRPLGLWPTSGKLAHTLLEVCFICAWSAALSLCFDNYFTSPIPCAPASSTAWYSQLTRPPLNSAEAGEIGGTICDSQLALICLVMVGLIMYCTNLVIIMTRIIDRPPDLASTAIRTPTLVKCAGQGRVPQRLITSDYALGTCLLLVVVLLWTSSNFVTQVDTPQLSIIRPSTTDDSSVYVYWWLPEALHDNVSEHGFLHSVPLAVLFAEVTWGHLVSPEEYQRKIFLGEQEPLTTQSSREVDHRFTPEETAKLAAYFCFLWFAANWMLNAALAYTSVASATVLSSMSGIFTLAVGRIFRVETVTLIKIGAVLASFGGVVLVSLSDSSSSSVPKPTDDAPSVNLVAILGDILALFSALFYAMYLIFLKVQIKDESRIDMQLFFGYVGLLNILLCWPVGLLLHWLRVESLEFPDTKETVLAILSNMFITLLSDYIYVIAMLKTTPLVVTVGLSLTIPLAVVGDYFLGKPATLQVLLVRRNPEAWYFKISESFAIYAHSTWERRARIGAHQPSAKLSKRRFAVQEDAVETVEIGAADSVEVSGHNILESLNAAPAIVSKKEKQQLKHEAFIDRIKSSTAPYSKTQRRRFNRKQREQLGGGLGSIEAVISALEEKEISPPAEAQSSATSQQRPQARARAELIGEGKGVPLTKAQRKHVLEMERLRHPLILKNPQYASNPFQTIRTHVQNTLEKRIPSV